MSEKIHGLPKAKVEKSYFTWLLWLVPLAAICLCGWFIAEDFLFSGPTLTIYFSSAGGLQKDDSLVKYRGIQIGQVQSLDLAPDRQRVIVRTKLNRSARNVARQGSIFWIVSPQVKLGSISGLQTIVAGDYIAVRPGDGARTNVFIGAEQEPVKPIPALDIILLAEKLDSLQKQSPIFYHEVQVGEVLSCQLGNDPRHVIVHARIREEYAPLLRANSKFWNAGGINFHFGLFSGAQISAESAQTLVSGGIAFATPPDFQSAATNGTVFQLYEKEDDSWKDWNPYIPLPAVTAMTNQKDLPPLDSK
ncbi:MAG TPA: MlaD family protein [Verrucomicrobiae bacterium]